MRMCFKNISEFLTKLDDDICEILGNNETVAVVGDYDFIKKLLNEYLLYINEGEYELVCCNLEMPELDGYDEAFIITFSGDGEIWVTKAYNDFNNKYYIHNADIAYVQEEFADKWHESNSPAIAISFSNGIKVMEDKWEDLKVNDNGKGFTYSGSNGNSNFFFEYSSSEKLPKEFIDVVKKLFS